MPDAYLVLSYLIAAVTDQYSMKAYPKKVWNQQRFFKIPLYIHYTCKVKKEDNGEEFDLVNFEVVRVSFHTAVAST